jgi:SAM-dependent methyltransferase
MPVHPKLADRTCYHEYEIEPGFFTPGQALKLEPTLCLDELGVPQNLAGLRALDIGAWDGPFTFELERRGAQVTAVDIQDPDVTIFNAVKEIKKSSATYVRGSIYDALPEDLGVFDIVLFVGVYYHLRSPVLALQRIRKLLADGGTLFVEGASATDYLAKQLNEALGLPKSSLRTTTEVLDQLPLSYFDIEQKIYGWTSWWYPTTRCLEVILLDSGFFNVTCALKPNAFYNYSHRRLMGRAEANPAKSDLREHKIYTRDFTSDQLRFSRKLRGLVSRLLPPGVRQILRQLRRKEEK